MNGTTAALTVRNLSVRFRDERRTAPVVHDLDLTLPAGAITGLAGESGSGKTLSALTLLGLADPRVFRTSMGAYTLAGESMTPAKIAAQRGRRIAMVFQDPATALDPVFSIGSQLTRCLRRQAGVNRHEARDRALGALEAVGFDDPGRVMASYPHHLSGGMRQLCVIAMAQALRPAVLLADEPTTALDAVSQHHVLEQLQALASTQGTAVLLITHDLRLLHRHARDVYLLYHGHLVERLHGDRLAGSSRHPYTRGLVDALPRLSAGPGQPARGIPGEPPTVGEPLPGCVFAPRCPAASDRCRVEAPNRSQDTLGELACHHPLEVDPGAVSTGDNP